MISSRKQVDGDDGWEKRRRRDKRVVAITRTETLGGQHRARGPALGFFKPELERTMNSTGSHGLIMAHIPNIEGRTHQWPFYYGESLSSST
jgi:hypothetical protein